jgi:hypothetical protein
MASPIRVNVLPRTTLKAGLLPKASIKTKTLPRIPGSVIGAGGITVEYGGAVWTVKPKWEDLASLASVVAADHELWIRNSLTGVYNRLTVAYLLNNLPAGPAGPVGPEGPPGSQDDLSRLEIARRSVTFANAF